MQVTEDLVKAWAHCRNPVCPGYGQEAIGAFRVETAYTYRDNGGDINGVERSNVELRWENPDQAPCHSCGHPRELSEHPRPSYQPLSGHDPMGLVNGVKAFDSNVVNTEADARVAALEAEVHKLAGMLKTALGEPED